MSITVKLDRTFLQLAPVPSLDTKPCLRKFKSDLRESRVLSTACRLLLKILISVKSDKIRSDKCTIPCEWQHMKCNSFRRYYIPLPHSCWIDWMEHFRSSACIIKFCLLVYLYWKGRKSKLMSFRSCYIIILLLINMLCIMHFRTWISETNICSIGMKRLHSLPNG